MSLPEPDIDAQIEEFFQRNLRELEADRGHALAPGVRATALNQVKLYYRRLQEIADKVTDTEVKLSLPGQHTPTGRPFTIEGVVDIVREKDRTVLYDIKTHDAEEIRANVGDYAKQLSIYAHIWQGLRQERLDETAVICTRYPRSVEQALTVGDDAGLTKALAAWEPVIPVPLEGQELSDLVREFGETVDLIEEHHFAAPELAVLQSTPPGLPSRFAVSVCRNCDARLSCASYREYARYSSAGTESAFRQYLDDVGDEDEVEDLRLAALEEAPPAIDD
ncbi:MAG: PD-(D/E)XK nuclease family protein [Gemmatimonadetes bacterium]|nr:PD-(D/E)XK nuclease family protein [Gemmatimonadota bacterium]